MFRLEKDMVPIIENSLIQKYNGLRVKREFNSGNGISDLTCAIIDGNRPDFYLRSFNEMYYLLNYFNIKGKKIIPGQWHSKQNLDKKTLTSLFSKLLNAGYLKEEDNYLVVEHTYKSPVKQVLSVEAKLKKWKEGFYQALRYKCFSHKSFLAISYEYVKNVDLSLLKENNIGLISVFPDAIKIVLQPKKENPSNKIAYYHLAESIIN